MSVLVGKLRKSALVSYGLFAFWLILMATLHLVTPFLTVLFSYLALSKLNFFRRKWIALLLFVILVTGAFCGFVYFFNRAFVALPEIVSTSIPVVVKFAAKHGIELPFADIESLKALALESVSEAMGYLGNFAKVATKEFVFLLIGIVVAIGIFLNPALDWDSCKGGSLSNLYSVLCAEISERFRSFYMSFETVIGAQVLISTINTVLTAIFVYGGSLKHATVIVILTFVCGLLPVVGNLLSNSMIVGIAFTISPQRAGWALVFLVVVHKLEYFLNSRIIGSRIKHPMWLMLFALVLGERLMGIGGIILAPVLLHFLKTEAMKVPVTPVLVDPVQVLEPAIK
ncbi:MAG: family transporter [Chthoniobacteraceae bacterium]|nr:family transporter [Chthoniobacteraceae bacterium]